MGFDASSLVEGAAGFAGVPGLDLVANLLGPALESKSVAGLNRSAGRLFRAGAPVIVASAMFRRGGTGADVWDAAVPMLGIVTAKVSGQTKHGYATDPPKDEYGKDFGLRPDYSKELFLQYLGDAAAGRDASSADSAKAASRYDWPKLLAVMGVNLASSGAPEWLIARAAASTVPSMAAQEQAWADAAQAGPAGTDPGASKAPGVPWWVWLLFPVAAVAFLVAWIAGRR